MNILTVVVIGTALCVPAAADAQSGSARRVASDRALAAVVAADRAFAKQSLDRGTQQAFVDYMSADGYLFRPRMVKAQPLLKARPMPRALLLAWEPTYADVSRAGDLGYTVGPWVSSRRDMGQGATTFGRYVSIWRKQANGSWRVEVHAGVAHAADPVGPTPIVGAPTPRYTGEGTLAAHTRSLFSADSALADAARVGNAAAAFSSRAGPDMRLLRMGRFPLTADSAIGLLRATPSYTWKRTSGGVATSGDLGYTYGVYAVPMPLKRTAETGDYLRIWRRESNGEWRVVLDLAAPGG